MALSRIIQWSPTSTFTSNAQLETRMFDFGNPHQKKKISKFHITFTGDTKTSIIVATIYYRFNNFDDYKFFGQGNTSGTGGRRMSIVPVYNSEASYQMERVLVKNDSDTSVGSFVRLNDVYTVQFKIVIVALRGVEINDYSVEYREFRSVSTSEPAA